MPMIRLAIKLALVGLMVHAGFKIVPVFWNQVRFRDALAETARFAGRKTEEELTAKAMRLAQTFEVPLNGAPITVKRGGNQVTTIDVRYLAQLEYLPRQYYPWEFVIHVAEAPPRFGEFIP